MGKERGDAQPHQPDEQLEMTVRAEQRLRLAEKPTVRPQPDDIAAYSQPQHDHRDHDRSRVDRVPKNVSKHANPYDLVDQSAEAGAKEQQIEDGCHLEAWRQG